MTKINTLAKTQGNLYTREDIVALSHNYEEVILYLKERNKVLQKFQDQLLVKIGQLEEELYGTD